VRPSIPDPKEHVMVTVFFTVVTLAFFASIAIAVAATVASVSAAA